MQRSLILTQPSLPLRKGYAPEGDMILIFCETVKLNIPAKNIDSLEITDKITHIQVSDRSDNKIKRKLTGSRSSNRWLKMQDKRVVLQYQPEL